MKKPKKLPYNPSNLDHNCSTFEKDHSTLGMGGFHARSGYRQPKNRWDSTPAREREIQAQEFLQNQTIKPASRDT